MGLLTPFMVTAVTLWRGSGTDGRGRRKFASPEVIRVRWDADNEMVATASGEKVQSVASIISETELNLGDVVTLGGVIDSSLQEPVKGSVEIIAVTPQLDERGEMVGYFGSASVW